MATTIVTETRDPGPRAMGGYDSGVFLAWIRAVNDVMMTGGDTRHMAPRTVHDLGGLLYALTESAEELIEEDRQVAINGRA